MSLWITIRKRLFGGRAEAEPSTNLGAKLNEAYILIKSKEYEKARRILLAILDSRESIDAATRGWIFDSLAVTWLVQEQFSEQIRFSSDYVNRYPDDCLGYRARAEAFWYEDRLSDAICDYSNLQGLIAKEA